MDWRAGFTAEYHLFIVNPDTWEDEREIPMKSGSISRSLDGNLAESATLELTEDIRESWIRAYLVARQDGAVERFPLFTGLTSIPKRDIDGLRETYSVDCYSVLKPASDKMTQLGEYVLAGTQAAKKAAEYLKKTGIRAVYSGNSPSLADSIVAESGETYLTMALKLIDAIGWHLRISGSGEVSIEPYTDDIRASFSGLDADVIEPSVSDSQDWYSCPNVLRVVGSSHSVTVRDDAAVRSRGREIWAEESVTETQSESLTDYARRRLSELQQATKTIEYTRRFSPDVRPGDLVRVSYPGVGIDGKYRVISQDIDMSYGCRTGEVSYEQ